MCYRATPQTIQLERGSRVTYEHTSLAYWATAIVRVHFSSQAITIHRGMTLEARICNRPSSG